MQTLFKKGWNTNKRQPLTKILRIALALSILLALGGTFLAQTPARAATPFTITEYSLGNAEPEGITAGADGNLWYTEEAINTSGVGKISTAGNQITNYHITTPGGYPYGITSGPNGNLWFVEGSSNEIGEMTTSGAMVAEYPVPTASAGLDTITTGPDGNLWFDEQNVNQIGRITLAGVVTEYPITTANSGPFGITAGPNGNLWFAESSVNQIGEMTPSGAMVAEFPLITANSSPDLLTAGPDGNIWFAENSGNNIGKITPTGVVTEYPVPTANAYPYGITAGSDGNLWFTEEEGNNIGEITPTGTITEYPIPSANADAGFITSGSDGNIWFTEFTNDKIGVLTLPPVPGEVNQSLSLPENTSKTTDVVTGISGSPDPSTLAITTQPKHGSATVSTTAGTITYTPSANYVGSDSLQYEICSSLDSGVCAKPTISYAITSVATAKVATTVKAPDTGFGTAPDPWTALYVVSPIALCLFYTAFVTRRRLTKKPLKPVYDKIR